MKKNSEVKKNNQKTLKDRFCGFKKRCFAIHLNTRYFSVGFFIVVFFVSIWVWWTSFYRPKPSRETVSSFEAGKENFEVMKSRTESAIEMLKERRGNFLNAPDFYSQRDLFVDERAVKELEEKMAKEQAVEDEQKGKIEPQNVFPVDVVTE
jgi:hypothetical protein